MRRRKRWMQAVDGARVEKALREAERRTSGELRVSVAPFFWGNPEREANRAFDRLGMTRTRERNGVLIFVVPSRRSFVIRGDQAIHAKVGQGFWNETARLLSSHFAEGRFTEGLEAAIHRLGEKLAVHFPRSPSDVNELPDQVDYGDQPREP